MRLESVCFVMDYLQLRFAGALLTCLSAPVIVHGSCVARFPEAGSRDALCALIGRMVVSAEQHADRLTVGFEGAAELEVPLVSLSAGPEVAEFTSIDDWECCYGTRVWENLVPTRDMLQSSLSSSPPALRKVSRPSFEQLLGDAPGAVWFFADRIELQLLDGTLSFWSAPHLTNASQVVRFPGPGSRDALCELISQEVTGTEQSLDRLLLRFERGTALEIPLADPTAGFEIARFVPNIDGRYEQVRAEHWKNIAAQAP